MVNRRTPNVAAISFLPSMGGLALQDPGRSRSSHKDEMWRELGPLDRAAASEPRQHLHFRIAGPASLFGRPRLGREPQAFACRRPPPAAPAPPPRQSWLNTPGETTRQRRRQKAPDRPSLATGPALRIRDCRSDNRRSFLSSNLFGNYLSSRGVDKSAGYVAKPSLPFPLHTTTRHHIESTARALNLPSCSAVSSSCVRPLQALDPGHPIGQHDSPQLATSPFPPMVGFTIPPPGLCQAADVDVLQLVRTWLILVNRIERGRRMRRRPATTPCTGGWAQARKGTPASCFAAFLLFMDTPRFHTRCISKMLCVYPGRWRFLSFPSCVCSLISFLFFYSSARVFVGWPVVFGL
jgi:hypothetical protein